MAHRRPSPRPERRGAPRVHQTRESRVRELGQVADEETCQQKSKAPDRSKQRQGLYEQQVGIAIIPETPKQTSGEGHGRGGGQLRRDESPARSPSGRHRPSFKCGSKAMPRRWPGLP